MSTMLDLGVLITLRTVSLWSSPSAEQARP